MRTRQLLVVALAVVPWLSLIPDAVARDLIKLGLRINAALARLADPQQKRTYRFCAVVIALGVVAILGVDVERGRISDRFAQNFLRFGF